MPPLSRGSARFGTKLAPPRPTTLSAAYSDGFPPPGGMANYGSVIDAKTDELRAVHDVLAEFSPTVWLALWTRCPPSGSCSAYSAT